MSSALLAIDNKSKIIRIIKSPSFYILFLFAVLYSFISLVNHYNYRTYAFDLGIYNNCLYQYGHFHKNHYPYLHNMFTDFLADHFSLYTVILSPLHYVFGSATLLYVQILSILIGSIAVYKIVKNTFTQSFLPEIAMIHYLSFFGIYSALAFDYHDNVVSAMLVPWFFYYFNAGKTRLAILFAILVVIGKENMPIWFTFICFGLFILHRKDKTKRNFSLVLAISSIIYAIVILKFVMPNLGEITSNYSHFHYSILGANLSELVSNVIHHPLKIIRALYFSHIPGAEFREIKFELYSCLAFSGGILLVLRPAYSVMLIPIIAQKVLSDDFGKWGISAHYSIEFVPIVVLGFYDVLSKIKLSKLIYATSILFCILTIYTTYSKLDIRKSIYYINTNGDPFLKEHYQCEFNKREVKRVMKLIPSNANLSCLSNFAPHLSFRKKIYQYPDVHDAEYVFIARCARPYPIYSSQMEEQISFYLQSKDWETISSQKDIFLFRKKELNSAQN